MESLSETTTVATSFSLLLTITVKDNAKETTTEMLLFLFAH